MLAAASRFRCQPPESARSRRCRRERRHVNIYFAAAERRRQRQADTISRFRQLPFSPAERQIAVIASFQPLPPASEFVPLAAMLRMFSLRHVDFLRRSRRQPLLATITASHATPVSGRDTPDYASPHYADSRRDSRQQAEWPPPVVASPSDGFFIDLEPISHAADAAMLIH